MNTPEQWLNQVGEAVAYDMFEGGAQRKATLPGQPDQIIGQPGSRTEAVIEAIQTDALSFMSYEALKEKIQSLPATWYPALIAATVQAALKKKVFLKDGATKLVARVEAEFEQGRTEALRV